MPLEDYLRILWLDDNEQSVFVALYKLGKKPASTLASFLSQERTSVYKILLRLKEKWLIYESVDQKVKSFFVPDAKVIFSLVQQQLAQYQTLHDQYPLIQAQLEASKYQQNAVIPKIVSFEGQTGIRQIITDMQQHLLESKYIIVYASLSDTVESKSMNNPTITQSLEERNQFLTQSQIQVKSVRGQGMLFVESLLSEKSNDGISGLSQGWRSTQLRVIGDIIYILLLKYIPTALKIENEELASMMRSLIELGK